MGKRARVDEVIDRMFQERHADYMAIAMSLESARTSLGQYPESVDQWMSVSPDARQLLRIPNGTTRPYEVRFDALRSKIPVIIVFDPGVNGFEFQRMLASVWAPTCFFLRMKSIHFG